jgi:hypothetical protein
VINKDVTLSEERSLAGLVLRDLVGSVLLAGLAIAVGVSGLRNVNIKKKKKRWEIAGSV